MRQGERGRERGREAPVVLVWPLTMKVVRVKPYQHTPLEDLRTVFRLHYSGCGVELDNIRDFPHTGHNSDIKLVDVVIRDSEISHSHTVTAIIKTINLTARHRLVGCQLTRFLTREVVFYTKIFPSILSQNQSRNDKCLTREIFKEIFLFRFIKTLRVDSKMLLRIL